MIVKASGGSFEIDDADFDIINKYSWEILCRRGGIVASVRIAACSRNAYGARTPIGRVLLNPPREMVVDHIDGNPLNNHRVNLRICTQHENTINRAPMRKKKSGTVGVHRHRNKWEARICLNRKVVCLGIFGTEQEAIASRKQAEKVYFGQFARKE
jgi:hypothetical protein